MPQAKISRIPWNVVTLNLGSGSGRENEDFPPVTEVDKIFREYCRIIKALVTYQSAWVVPRKATVS